MASEFSWQGLDWAAIAVCLDVLTQQDATVSFMLGGYGHYYKISWYLNGKPDFVTTERSDQIVAKLWKKVQGYDLER